MFCSQCGSQISPGARFCAGCGRPLASGTPNLARPTTIANPYRGKKLQIIGALVAVLGLLLIVASCPGAMAGGEVSGGASAGLLLGGVVLLAGLVLSAVGKFHHWYHAE